ncbi:MAG: hypothetical protein WA960_23335 [Tunicatimonas sp.]
MSDLFEESKEFISNNTTVKSNEIPRHLRDYWLDMDRSTNPEHRSPQSLVFLYALIKYQNDNGLPGAIFSDEDLSRLYGTWQMILFLEDFCERMNTKVDAVDLFDFGKYPDLRLKLPTK